MLTIEQISIIGYGNVGKALCTYFMSKNIEVVEIIVRKLPDENLDKLPFRVVSDLSHLTPVDLVFVCVNDSSVNDIIRKISPNQFVVYTSGSVHLDDLSRKENCGVFYPLQTFSSNSKMELRNVPILLESSNSIQLNALLVFANRLFNRVEVMNSSEREKIHLAAVFANNFTNHLFHLATCFLNENQLDFSLLHPLINETVQKLNNHSPFDAQTGPARRQDNVTLQKHTDKLNGIPLELYQLFTKSIKETYKKK